ncbi:hypothetical protein CY34DRAFT_106744 [Suillus luteus UH-Slu-Lm8-n1]|uniref:Uncharacterized protein n=1 Tax=Suillus luteus UH-Slu-Lm8-n1 TaxID=930992 RepID=A0A0D0B8P3_9AGAM|nr:hypothetical protein CY34DRAFT_106744 [Suillus luteus UH-Slu-Lm8-n1]
MSSNFSVPLKAIWSDYRNTLTMNVLPGEHTVETTVGKLGKSMYKHVSREFSLQSLELGTIDMPARYYPDVDPSTMLRDCGHSGLTVVFTPDPQTQDLIKTELARNAQGPQTYVQPNTTSTASSSSTANPPQVTMDSQLKEMLASMQASMQTQMEEMRVKHENIRVLNDMAFKEIKTVRNENERILKENGSMHNKIERILKENGSMHNKIESMGNQNERILKENERILKENERILKENGSMHNKIESMGNQIESMRHENERISTKNDSLHLDNERIHSELASVRKDLEAARNQHTEDVEALRILTLSLVPLHLRVLLDRARGRILEHLGHESWEGLRSTRSIHQLANEIFNSLKTNRVSYSPSYKAIYFLCSYNNIRRAGNAAAHTAKEEEVRHAVQTQPLDSQDREYLENLFRYAYDGNEV